MPSGRVTSATLRELEDRARRLPRGGVRIGYRVHDVDRFVGEAIDGLRTLVEANETIRAGDDPAAVPSRGRPRVGPLDVQAAVFEVARFRSAYRMRPVDELLDDVTDAMNVVLAEREALGSRPTG
jgi:cell division septum initiation protein DivIVA